MATRKKTSPSRRVHYVSTDEGADVSLLNSRYKFLSILDKECPQAREELRKLQAKCRTMLQNRSGDPH